MQPLIVIVSNRGPFSFKRNPDGTFRVERGAGGLVTALTALAEKHDVLWVAAAMSKDDNRWAQTSGEEPQMVEGISLRLMQPKPKAYQGYYNVISNPMLWFIQHQLWDAPRNPSITQETWDAWEHGYVEINKDLAGVVADSIKQEERPVIILLQDYHLYLMPHYLRKLLGSRVQIQPFIHIPWPGPDAWQILPDQMQRDGPVQQAQEPRRV